MAEGGGDMGFAHSGRSDEDQVGRFFKPLGVEKLQDFVPGDFGVEGPVEVPEEFDPFDSGLAQEMFDSFLFPQLLFLGEKASKKVLSYSERSWGSVRSLKCFHRSDKVVIVLERPPFIGEG